MDVPAKDDPNFVAIHMIQQPTQIRPNDPLAPAVYSPVWECGKLRLGNGDPTHPDFYSLTDYAYGEDGIEVRLPWQMLNFSNPARLQIHQDYYETYGVEEQSIQAFYVGIGKAETKINLVEAALSRWKKAFIHERKKQSYYIVQEAWRIQP